MLKRNFILLIIVLVVVVIAIFGFLYFQQNTTTPGADNQGTNFISLFNPFGNGKTKPPKVTPPVTPPEYQPNPPPEIKIKLKKVSTMPIAGFGVYIKERLKDIPITPKVTTPADNSTTQNTTPPTPVIKGKTTAFGRTPPKAVVIPTPPLTEFVPALRYVDKATGNIYQTFADKIIERRFSTTVIPKIYEAYFGVNGESVVMRYLKADGRTIETFVGNLPKEYLGADTTSSNEVKGSFLPDNVKDISISPDATSIFYLFSSGGNLENNMVGTTLNLLNNKKVQIFDSPFTEWTSLWPSNNGVNKMITFTTKPSSGVPGYMYATDPSSNLSAKNLNKILGGINGLTTLTSPSGKLVLYGNDNLSLVIYHTDTKASDQLGVKTLPEKCVWGKASDTIYCAVPKLVDVGQYPDTWYQGEVSFSDQIWKIDIKTGNATMIVDPNAVGGEEIDGIKLAIDEGENYLLFVNKKDSFLWELELK